MPGKPGWFNRKLEFALPTREHFRRNHRVFAVRLGFLALLLAAPLAAQSPVLKRLEPAAVRPGATQPLTLHGDNLRGATNWWSATGATVVSAKAVEPSVVKLQVAVPAAAPVGIYATRVASTNGVSNPLLFMVDDLPSIFDAGANLSLTTAQTLVPPVAVDGTTPSLGVKQFRFTAKAGERLAFEAVARRLNSKLDPVLRLLDSRGRELAFSDDESGLGGDCRLAHTFAASGDYFLELRDISYGGGSEYFFRLRVGDFPFASLTFPAAVQAGTTATFNFVGPQVEKISSLTATAPTNTMRLALTAKFPGGNASGFAAALVTDTPEVSEVEPNDSAETATPFTLPAGLNGRFLKPKDRDFWRFTAKKGQRVLFTAQTRSLGSASEVTLQLRDAQGTAIASSTPGDPGEGSVTNTLPADGTYFLVVDELIRRGGSAHAYRVEAELLGPAFALETETEKIEVAPGGTFTVKVSATRRDFTGPITLAVLDLDGAALADEVIKEKASSTTLKLTLPETVTPGALLTFRLLGQATLGERATQAFVHTTPALKKLFPNTPTPPRELDTVITLGVRAR